MRETTRHSTRQTTQPSTRRTGRTGRTLLVLLFALGLAFPGLVLPGLVTPAFGATAIQAEHQRLGGADGRLGRALGAERCGLVRSGCYQKFERGTIHWSPRTGARPTWGAIRAAWAAQDHERGPLG